MEVAKRKEKACKNGTKENPRTRVRTSGEKNSPPGQPNYTGQAQGEEPKRIKRGASLSPLLFLGQPTLMPCQIKLSCNTGPLFQIFAVVR